MTMIKIFGALSLLLFVAGSNGQATCDQQALTNYLNCLTSDANSAVQFIAVTQTDSNFVSSLSACFTRHLDRVKLFIPRTFGSTLEKMTDSWLSEHNGCNAPTINTTNVSSNAVCENAIAQDATILQDFRTCFEAKNFTLPSVSALANPPFNVRKYSQSNLRKSVKKSCSSAVSKKKTLVKRCLSGLFANNSPMEQNSQTLKIEKIFGLKKESCGKLSVACQSQYTKMRTAACSCSQTSHFPQTYAPTTQCPRGATMNMIRKAVSNYYCDFFKAGS